MSRHGSSSSEREAADIKVVARFRPETRHEQHLGGKPIVALDPLGCSFALLPPMGGKSHEFTFDRVFGSATEQDEIFEELGKPCISDIFSGYNSTIFAYGQTSSGKTFSMLGPSDASVSQLTTHKDRGLIPRLVCSLFDTIESFAEDVEFSIKVSFFEIYMERIHDLLSRASLPSFLASSKYNSSRKTQFSPLVLSLLCFAAEKTNLVIKEDKSSTSLRGVYVDGLTELYCSSAEEVLQYLNRGSVNRAVAETRMNVQSSRSHSIFNLTITQNDTKRMEKRISRLHLVDLAGSEKLEKTHAEGVQLEEAKQINQSLTTLARVINILTEGKGYSHVPYRDSKLTRFLQDSLGGNSRTTLLINVSPSSVNEAETLSSLRFGVRAKKIKNKPRVNRELGVAELRQLLSKSEDECNRLRACVAELNAEMETLRMESENLRKIATAMPSPPSAIGSLPLPLDASICLPSSIPSVVSDGSSSSYSDSDQANPEEEHSNSSHDRAVIAQFTERITLQAKQLSDINQQRSVLEARQKVLLDQLHRKTVENREKSEESSNLRTQISVRDQRQEELEHENAILTERLADLYVESSRMQDECLTLVTERDLAVSEISALRDQLAQEHASASMELDELRRQLFILEEENSQQQQNSPNGNAEADALRAEFAVIRDKLAFQVQALTTENEVHRREINSIREKHSAEKSKLSHELDSLRNEIVSLKHHQHQNHHQHPQQPSSSAPASRIPRLGNGSSSASASSSAPGHRRQSSGSSFSVPIALPSSSSSSTLHSARKTAHSIRNEFTSLRSQIIHDLSDFRSSFEHIITSIISSSPLTRFAAQPRHHHHHIPSSFNPNSPSRLIANNDDYEDDDGYNPFDDEEQSQEEQPASALLFQHNNTDLFLQETELKHARTLLSDSESKNKELTKKCSDYESEMQSLKESVARLQRDNEFLKKGLESRANNSMRVEQQVEDLRLYVRQLTSKSTHGSVSGLTSIGELHNNHHNGPEMLQRSTSMTPEIPHRSLMSGEPLSVSAAAAAAAASLLPRRKGSTATIVKPIVAGQGRTRANSLKMISSLPSSTVVSPRKEDDQQPEADPSSSASSSSVASSLFAPPEQEPEPQAPVSLTRTPQQQQQQQSQPGLQPIQLQSMDSFQEVISSGNSFASPSVSSSRFQSSAMSSIMDSPSSVRRLSISSPVYSAKNAASSPASPIDATLADLDRETVLKCGYLMKKRSAKGADLDESFVSVVSVDKWSRRWCLLKAGTLSFYKRVKDLLPTRTISLATANVRSLVPDDDMDQEEDGSSPLPLGSPASASSSANTTSDQLRFIIATIEKQYYLEAFSVDEKKAWVASVQRAIDIANARTFALSSK